VSGKGRECVAVAFSLALLGGSLLAQDLTSRTYSEAKLLSIRVVPRDGHPGLPTTPAPAAPEGSTGRGTGRAAPDLATSDVATLTLDAGEARYVVRLPASQLQLDRWSPGKRISFRIEGLRLFFKLSESPVRDEVEASFSKLPPLRTP